MHLTYYDLHKLPLVLFPADMSWHLMEMKIGTSVLLLNKFPLRSSVAIPYGENVFTFLLFIRYYMRRSAQLLQKNEMKPRITFLFSW